ncbi:MAG: SDR family oxidoreductase [Bdellovibrionales bacterium]|nr:SDR family oxidoreductase [Bdellovibrionales bacterium]
MKIAVIGSNRGIGLEFVNQLSEQNEVYAFCRSASEELRALKPAKIVEGFDTSNPASMSERLEQVSDVKFDWVLVVSGILTSEGLDSFDHDRILRQFQVNSLGAIECARQFSPHVNSGGKIGLLTSRMGSIADNGSGGMYGYRMSKAALNAGGKSLALDLKDNNLTVLLLHPGYVKTDMTNHSGLIETDESVKGLVTIMQSKGLEQTGSFWHTNGEELPW